MYIPYVLGFLNPLFTASIFFIFLDVRSSSHFSPAGCWDPWTSWKQNAFLYSSQSVSVSYWFESNSPTTLAILTPSWWQNTSACSLLACWLPACCCYEKCIFLSPSTSLCLDTWIECFNADLKAISQHYTDSASNVVAAKHISSQILLHSVAWLLLLLLLLLLHNYFLPFLLPFRILLWQYISKYDLIPLVAAKTKTGMTDYWLLFLRSILMLCLLKNNK